MKIKLSMSVLVVSALLVCQAYAQAKKTPSKDILLYSASAFVGVLAISAGTGLIVHKINSDRIMSDLDNRSLNMNNSLKELANSIDYTMKNHGNKIKLLEEKIHHYHGVDEGLSDEGKEVVLNACSLEGRLETDGSEDSGDPRREMVLADSSVNEMNEEHVISDLDDTVLPDDQPAVSPIGIISNILPAKTDEREEKLAENSAGSVAYFDAVDAVDAVDGGVRFSAELPKDLEKEKEVAFIAEIMPSGYAPQTTSKSRISAIEGWAERMAGSNVKFPVFKAMPYTND